MTEPHRSFVRSSAQTPKARAGLDAFFAAGAPEDADAETALSVRIVNAINLLAAGMHLAAFTTYWFLFDRLSAEALGYACARMVCYAIASAGYWKTARTWTLALTAVFFLVVFQNVSPGWGGEFLLAILLAMPLSIFRRSERVQSLCAFVGCIALSVYVLWSTHQNALPFENPHQFYWPVFYVTLGTAVAALTGLIAVLRASLLRLYDQVEAERGLNDALLRNILPVNVVEKLRGGQNRVAEGRAEVTVVFLDLVGFTDLTRRLGPNHLIEVLDGIFSELDDAAESLGVEKVKTIGDAYMAATGLTNDPGAEDAAAAAAFALNARRVIDRAGGRLGRPLQARIGLHTGPVVAGVLGRAKAVFDIWGEAVNVAARLEASAAPGQILVSEQTYWRLHGRFSLRPLGALDLKGQGATAAYELAGERTDAQSDAVRRETPVETLNDA